MLNRIKKNLIIMAITGTMCLALPSFAYDSTISYINVNNLAYPDIEIVIDNNKILVPFKQLADIFEIKYDANRIDKKISFTTIDGRQGEINPNGIFIDGSQLTSPKPIFIQNGIIDGVCNDAYIPESVASQVMGVEIKSNFETLSLEAHVNREIGIIKTAVVEDDSAPKAYKDVAIPKKPSKITLNTIGLRSNIHDEKMRVDGGYFRNKSDMLSGSTQLSLNGRMYGGKYRIEATENHYKNDKFMFGGLTATYRNKITNENTGKDYYYELGKVRGSVDEDAILGTNIFGAQLWTWDNEQVHPRELSGYVKPTSIVRVTVNNEPPFDLNTYAGYYTLSQANLPREITKIKLEEVNEDGTTEVIMEKEYSALGADVPSEGEKRLTAYSGVWGYQNRLFREGNKIYRGNNKKVTSGAEYIYGIQDNVTFKSKLTGDLIYKKETPRIYYSMPTNDALLVSGTSKSVNFREGATTLNSVEWKNEHNKHIKARATLGGSVMHDIQERRKGFGYSGKLTGEYDQDLSEFSFGIFQPRRINAKIEAFDNSPDWYIASTDSISKNDRIGGRISGGFGFNQTTASGSYTKYKSNNKHRYQGGKIDFDEIALAGSTVIPKVATLAFTSNYRKGQNNLGRNKNYNYDASAERMFFNSSKIKFGRRENLYDTRYYNQTDTDKNYFSKYTDHYIRFDTPLPKNCGKFAIDHNMIKYKYIGGKKNYNMFHFTYTLPTWKRLTLSLGWGFKYHGMSGNDFGVNLGYRAPSGQQMSIGYQYAKDDGYFIDNMFAPKTNRHTVLFSFNDAFQFFSRGLKSVGDEDMGKGLYEAIAFVDMNHDGKYTKGVDIPIKDIPLITDRGGTKKYTNKWGRIYSDSLEEGIYNVALDMDELPMTVAPLSNDKIVNKVKIDGGRTTKLEIPLISTVGSVSGVLKISDDFNRDLKITDFVVVLLDSKGEEVNYSTVTPSGEFYISGLAPGKYTLQLDERYIDAYGLEKLNKSSRDILIPYDYQNPTDLMDQDLEYRALAL